MKADNPILLLGISLAGFATQVTRNLLITSSPYLDALRNELDVQKIHIADRSKTTCLRRLENVNNHHI